MDDHPSWFGRNPTLGSAPQRPRAKVLHLFAVKDGSSMPAPSKPTRTTPRKPRAAADRKPTAAPRRRTVRKAAVTPAEPAGDRAGVSAGSAGFTGSTGSAGSDGSARDTGRQTEQLAMVGLAIVLGLIGFAVHFLWFGAVVTMAVLFGLIASEVRGRRSGGVIVEVVDAVVSEAKSVAQAATSTGGPDGAATAAAKA
jgi:hypothetical protein